MFKKILFSFVILSLLMPIICFAEGEELLKEAGSGILIEANSGQILFEKEKDKRVSVASMTKMVAQIIILEHIEKGTLKWEEKIKVSANAANMGGTQIYLQPGEEMSVKDIFKGISMASANDGTVALAERIAGTEKAFVDLMNKKVKELGLKNTNFVNSTGLDEGLTDHYSSAYDMAMVARYLVLNHEKILEFSSVYEDYLRQGTQNKFWLVNTNKLVRFYQGADGLKTGFTDAAKYCMAVTAKRDGMRLIAVVLGEAVSKTRNAETTELLDYGFNIYKVDQIKSKKETIKEVKIEKGTKEKIKIGLKNDISALKKKSEVSKDYDISINIKELSLPIKKGDIVGELIVKDGGKIITKEALISKDEVKKMSFVKMFFETLKDYITGDVM